VFETLADLVEYRFGAGALDALVDFRRGGQVPVPARR
jgi:hypothetical protein